MITDQKLKILAKIRNSISIRRFTNNYQRRHKRKDEQKKKSIFFREKKEKKRLLGCQVYKFHSMMTITSGQNRSSICVSMDEVKDEIVEALLHRFVHKDSIKFQVNELHRGRGSKVICGHVSRWIVKRWRRRVNLPPQYLFSFSSRCLFRLSTQVSDVAGKYRVPNGVKIGEDRILKYEV